MSTYSIQLLAVLAMVLILNPLCHGEKQTLFKYKKLNNYEHYIAGSSNVSVWFGERTALVIDKEEKPEQRNQEVMTKILSMLDDLFDHYETITNQKPKLNGPFRRHAVVEVSDTVGGGLAHHGSLGIAVGSGFFEGLYKRVEAGEHTLDQVFFYEIARNYWPNTFNPRIDYHTSKGKDDYGWWTVGFNNALSIFLPQDIGSISDMYYFGQTGKEFSEGMEQNLDHYLNGEYTWEKAWCTNLMPWSERTSLNDLMTALLIQLHRDHGGNTFIANLYQEIPKLRKLRGKDDYQGARDNFYIAASLAANKDLFDYFSKLHWTISEKAKKSISRKLQD